MTAHLVTPIIVLTLLATVSTACSTTTSVAGATGVTTGTGTGDGSALPRDTKDTKDTKETAKDPKDNHADLPKGELMGTGVGAAAGALYDVKKRR